MDDVKVIPVPHPHPPAESAWASASASTSKLCTRYRTARLRALHADPAAFSSTYEREEQFEERDWLKRLMNRDSRTFVAVESTTAITSRHGAYEDWDEDENRRSDVATESEMNMLTEHEWIGMIVLLGPRVLADDENNDNEEGSSLWTAFTPYTPDPPTLALNETENKELAFLAVSMFVLPEIRGRGIGTRLIEASLEYMRRRAAELKARKVCVALWVEEGNTGARRCYEKCGFEYLRGGVSLEQFGETRTSVGMVKVMEVGPDSSQ